MYELLTLLGVLLLLLLLWMILDIKGKEKLADKVDRFITSVTDGFRGI